MSPRARRVLIATLIMVGITWLPVPSDSPSPQPRPQRAAVPYLASN